MMEPGYKDPYSAKYFFGLIVALGLPTLPASLTLFSLFSS